MNSPYEEISSQEVTLDLKAYEDVLTMVREDMLSEAKQKALVDAMSTNIQRELVQTYSSLDASVVVTFKKQLGLVDTVLRRIVNEDGSSKPSSEDYDISLKDALNLSLRVTQIMVKDLPKVYNIARVQKMEEALRRTMEETMTSEQQRQFLVRLEEVEAER